MDNCYDIAVVGGGINGIGIARDASGRGLSVLVAEKNDLASGTSSAATKLIHGGIRYLEQYEFGLVRESLSEREVLWKLAPHIIHPLRFVLPHEGGLRPAWLIRLGLFLYDYIGGRKKLPASNGINLRKHVAGTPLKKEFVKGFEYSDCWANDARLVVLNAMDARNRGADIRVRTEVVGAKRGKDYWELELFDSLRNTTSFAKARVLVNAAGPWVAEFLNKKLGYNDSKSVRLVKGSHIVVKKMFDHDYAYIFQNADRRIVFAIPYEQDYTLIGTTDVEYEDDPGDVRISEEEKEYLCEAVSSYFDQQITPEDIVWHYSGVRPLFDDGDANPQEVTRDFVLDVKADDDQATLLNIYGGKLTTYRYLADKALKKLQPWLGIDDKEWTASEVLPGGDFPLEGLDDLLQKHILKYPDLSVLLLMRLTRSYGTCVEQVLGNASHASDLGICFGSDLYEKEVRYLVDKEWARTAEDILWRRSKLGLKFSQEEIDRLEEWLHGYIK